MPRIEIARYAESGERSLLVAIVKVYRYDDCDDERKRRRRRTTTTTMTSVVAIWVIVSAFQPGRATNTADVKLQLVIRSASRARARL